MSKHKRTERSSHVQHLAADSNPKRQLALARQAHAKGAIGVEDFIWTAMQCYAADSRQGQRPLRLS